MPAVRDRLFVAGKSDRSNPDGVRAHLERTLERLGCDHLDLYQLHGVTSLEVLEQRSAAAEVILAARDEGLTRFVGITGHDLGTPRAQLEALRRYDLDTVMFPVYPRVWADPVYRTDAEALLAECAATRRRRDGHQGRRPPALGRGRARPRSTWYEPHTDADAIARGIAFALSTDGVHAFCTPGDLGLLPTVLDAAEANGALDEPSRDDAMAAAMEHEVIFPLRGEGPPSLTAGRGCPRHGVSAQTALAAATARATVSADAERTRLTRCRRESDQISHLLGSYCHQCTPLR